MIYADGCGILIAYMPLVILPFMLGSAQFSDYFKYWPNRSGTEWGDQYVSGRKQLKQVDAHHDEGEARNKF